ncbi:MAG: hypothetical protein JW730_02605, partial [Anaerolineales bacterium]|nr:hypothetical protein [Anaerolineales bacterium]
SNVLNKDSYLSFWSGDIIFFQPAVLLAAKLPNTACTRRVGVGAFSGSLRGLRLVPAKWRYPMLPLSSLYKSLSTNIPIYRNGYIAF